MAQLQTTAVTGSLTVTGQITAQTLNVQQVTSSIVYSSGSNRFGNLVTDVQQMTGSLRVTGSGAHYIVGGNVGIGTISPATPLHVQGGLAGTGGWNRTATLAATYPALIFNSNGSKWAGMAYDYSAAMRFWVNANNDDIFAGTQVISILNNGNIGINTSSPAYKLDVVGASRFGESSTIIVSTDGTYGTGYGTVAFGGNTNGFNRVFGGTGTADGLYLASATGRGIFFRPNGGAVDRMTLTASGSLLVGGTAIPSETAWSGTAAFGVNGTNKVIIGYLGSSTSGAVIGGHNSALNAWADLNINATNIIFRSSEVERMRMASTGNVGIGTTAPTALLHIYGTGATRGLKINATTATEYAEVQLAASAREYRVGVGGASSIAPNQFYIYDATPQLVRVTLNTDGNVGIGTTSPAARLQVSGSSNVLNVKGSGSLSTSSLFSVDGAFGRLFEVTDDLSNSLFSVNTIAGLPVIEAFADYSVNLGTYSAASGSTMRITGSSVGIGTTNPVMNLQIDSTGFSFRLRERSDGSSLVMSGNQIQARTSANGGSDLYLNFNNGGNILMAGSGTNVGIGTTAPTAPLHIARTAAVSPSIRLQTTNSTTNGSIAWANNSNTTLAIIGSNANVSDGQGNLEFMTGGTTTRMMISSSGVVGIGTTAPGYPLHVVGNIFSSAGVIATTFWTNDTIRKLAAGAAMNFRNSAGNTEMIISSSGEVGIGTIVPDARLTVSASSGDLATFYTGTTKRLTITTGGNISFNTGTSLGLVWSPASLLFEGQTLGITARPYAANYVSFTVAGAAGQTANLQTWQAQGGTVYSVVDAAGDFAIQATASIGKLQLGSDWTANPGGGNQVYLSNTGFANSAVIPEAIITTNNASTTPGGTIGLALHNNNVTAGAFSPLLVFSKRETGSTPYNASIAAIGARTVTGTGAGDGWIDGDLMFYTAPTAGSGLVERMRIIQDGNVGIGTTIPGDKLEVVGNVYSNAFNSVGTLSRYASNGGIAMAGLGGSAYAYIIAYSNSSGTPKNLGLQTIGGNVGIGTTSPTNTLQVIGGITALSLTGSLLGTASYATQALSASYAPGGASQWTTTGNNIYYTTGNVGIGTSTVGRKLDVYGDGTIARLQSPTANQFVELEFSASGAGSAYIFKNSSGYAPYGGTGSLNIYNTGNIGFHSDSTFSIMTLLRTGNVGIGNTAPTAPLSFANAAGNKIDFYYTLASGGDRYGIQVQTSELRIHAGALGDSTGGITFGKQSTSTFTEAMRITNGGNVGIGSTAPTQKLDVAGAIRTTSNILLPTDGMIDWGSGDARIVEGEVSNYSLSFKLYDPLTTTVPVRLFMSASGNIGIGTTTPAYTLDVSGSIRTQVGSIIGQNANADITLDGNTGSRIRYSGQSVTLDSTVAYISTNSNIRLYVTNGGSVGIGTTSPARQLSIYNATSTYLGLQSAAYRTYTIGSDPFGFGIYDDTGALYRLTINASGYVGIGTTSAATPLQVIGNATIGQASNNSTNSSLDITAGGSGNDAWVDFGYWNTFDTSIYRLGYYGSHGGAFKILDTGGGTAYDRMVMSGASLTFPSSSVGIGTTSVSARFEIKSSATNNLGGLLLRATSTANFPAVLYENSSNGGTLDLYNAAALNTRINSNGASYFNGGSVGIGTTAPGYVLDIIGQTRIQGNVTNGPLLVNGGDSTGAFVRASIAFGFNATDGYYHWIHTRHNGGTAANNALDFYTSDGTQNGTFPTNGVHGLTISAGSVGVNTTSPATTFHVQGTTTISGSLRLSGSAIGIPEHMVVALSDETTNLTTGTGKLTMRAPFAMRLTDRPRASLSTASTSGLVTVDINEAGTSVLGANKLSIDANELTSTTAATPTTIADALIADDAQIRFDIDAAGTGARGLKVTLYYIRI